MHKIHRQGFKSPLRKDAAELRETSLIRQKVVCARSVNYTIIG